MTLFFPNALPRDCSLSNVTSVPASIVPTLKVSPGSISRSRKALTMRATCNEACHRAKHTGQ